MLRVFEDLPLCKHLIPHAVKRFKLKKEHNLHAKKKEESKNIVWKPWQQELLRELEGSPDARKIIWYYDPVGNTGKTFFAKWQNELSKTTAVLQSGKAKDMYHILSKHTEEIQTVLMDFTRSAEYEVDYNVIESVKNGYFQSGKYDSKCVIMPTPHLVVFANFKPRIEKLSVDRWDMRILSESQPTLFCVPTDTLEVYKASMCFIHRDYFCFRCCPSHPENIVCVCKCTKHKKVNCDHGHCKKDDKGKKNLEIKNDNEGKNDVEIKKDDKGKKCTEGMKDAEGTKNDTSKKGDAGKNDMNRCEFCNEHPKEKDCTLFCCYCIAYFIHSCSNHGCYPTEKDIEVDK
jgi:hypothetical protein